MVKGNAGVTSPCPNISCMKSRPPDTVANLGINLGPRNKGLTTRSHTQNLRLRLSQTLNTYLVKYIPQ